MLKNQLKEKDEERIEYEIFYIGEIWLLWSQQLEVIW